MLAFHETPHIRPYPAWPKEHGPDQIRLHPTVSRSARLMQLRFFAHVQRLYTLLHPL